MTNRWIKHVLASVLGCALAGQGLALAQEKGDGDEEASEARPAEGAAPAEMAGTTEKKVGPIGKEDYSQSVIFRPLTMPKGMFELEGGLIIFKFSINLGQFGSDSASVTGLYLGARYGITDQLEVSLKTAFEIDPDTDWGKVLDPRVSFLALDTEKLDIAPGADLILDFQDSGDTSQVLRSLNIYANTRYLLSDQVWLFGGDAFQFGNFLPTGGLLQVDFGGDVQESAMSLNLNVGVGFQVHKQVAIAVATQLTHIKLSGDNNRTTAFFLSDADDGSTGKLLPLAVSGVIGATKTLDIVADVSFLDLLHASDFLLYAITLGVNVHI